MENAIQEQADRLVEDAARKAEQLAEDARRKADRLKEEARVRAQRLMDKANEKVAQGKEKIAEGKKEIVRAGKTTTEKFFSSAVIAMVSVFGIKFLHNEYAIWSHNKETTAALDSAIKKEENKGHNLSYLLAEYNQFSNMIEEATDGAGTDTQVIDEVFGKMENNADILQLIKSYGKRPNTWFGISIGKYTLNQLLISELSHSERTRLNAILQKKGITIIF